MTANLDNRCNRNWPELTRQLKDEALRAGFSSVGITPAVPAAGFERLREWLEAGFAGQMEYLERRLDAYRSPGGVLDGARSVVMLSFPYQTQAPRVPTEEPLPAGHGRVSRYAWGSADYHDLIHERLRQLCRWVEGHDPAARIRGVVDTAPLLEREFAQRAGLGWIGKHTLLLNRRLGSWFFLAALITDLDLTPDPPDTTDYCGSCRACLDVCPTEAFVQPYVLDARRCISYLTIELRGPVDRALRSRMGDWVFGCDLCQEVCPWNRHAPVSRVAEIQPQADLDPLELSRLFEWSDEQFRAHFRHTPLWRTRRRGLLRNAAIVLGNQRDRRYVPCLVNALGDGEPWVRGAAAWALGQIADLAARPALQDQLRRELDPQVRDELLEAAELLEPDTKNGRD